MRGRSTIGRPRALTDDEVIEILSWHDAFKALSAQRKALRTVRQLAADLGVPRSTVYDVIRRRGEFKLPGRVRGEEESRHRQARIAKKTEPRVKPKPK